MAALVTGQPKRRGERIEIDAPPASFYRGDRTPTPAIVVGFFLDTHDGRRSMRSLYSDCRRLELVRLDEWHAVVVLKSGKALELPK